jgi:hypothetical protein
MSIKLNPRVLKRIGGWWMDNIHAINSRYHVQVDGDKFICLDAILTEKEPCLIYSFGINNEWTFEDQMDKQGCSIYAYDHTIDAPAERGNNIKFFKQGLGVGDSLKTLGDTVKDNGHSDTAITYLKVISGNNYELCLLVCQISILNPLLTNFHGMVVQNIHLD